MKILAIILSFLFGGFFGVTTICLATAAKSADDYMSIHPYKKSENEKKTK
ncbi:MAG: DUF3789 domain-containing protein [Ruminococcus sp.]